MTDTPDDKRTQSLKFIDKAKDLGCDEDEAAFEQKLRGIAKAQPKEERND